MKFSAKLILVTTFVLFFCVMCIGQDSLGDAARRARAERAAKEEGRNQPPRSTIATDSYPISDLQIMAWLCAQVYPIDLVNEIKLRGIDFNPNDVFVADLKLAGASPEVTEEVQTAKQLKDDRVETGPERLRALAEVAREMHSDDTAAVKDLGGLIQQDVTNSDLMFALSQVFRNEEDFYSMGGALAAIEKNDPGMPFVHARLSYLYYRMGDSENAFKEASLSTKQRPQSVESLKVLGLAIGMTNLEVAKATFTRAIEMAPDIADLYYDRGITHVALNEWDQAISDYQTADRLRPNDESILNNLGIAQVREGRFEDAFVSYKTAIALSPDDMNYRQNLGAALCKSGHYQEAVTELRELLKRDPTWNTARPCLENSLRALGRDKEADQVHQEWIERGQ